MDSINPAANDQLEDAGQAERPIRDELAEVILALSLSPLAEGQAKSDQALRQADGVLALLNQRGFYLPGCPPAKQLLADAELFAAQLMLAMIVCRCYAMLDTGLVTPETKGMRNWLADYVNGRNHGPVGKPMHWPAGLPGLCSLLRDWGYAPTPTQPAFVARKRHNVLENPS